MGWFRLVSNFENKLHSTTQPEIRMDTSSGGKKPEVTKGDDRVPRTAPIRTTNGPCSQGLTQPGVTLVIWTTLTQPGVMLVSWTTPGNCASPGKVPARVDTPAPKLCPNIASMKFGGGACFARFWEK